MAPIDPKAEAPTRRHWTALVIALLVAVGLLAIAYFAVDSRAWRIALICLAALVAAGGPLSLYARRGKRH
jgi:hypothetical protein